MYTNVDSVCCTPEINVNYLNLKNLKEKVKPSLSLEASDLLFVDHLNTQQQGLIQGPLTVGHQVGCLPGGKGFPGHKRPHGGKETVKECVSCLGCTFQSLMIEAPTSTRQIT